MGPKPPATAATTRRRMPLHSLPLFVRLQGKPVILIGAGDAADAKRRLLDRAGAVIVGEDDENARLAIIALDDDAAAEAAAHRLKARGILVNAVDRVVLCDFTLPAIIDRDPVLIAIGTGGASAGLAKALRQRLEILLPQSLGALATALSAARGALRNRFPDPADRRKAIDAALSERGPLDPLAGEGDVAAWLADAKANAASGIETIMLASPDPDDLTLKQARLLGSADHVYHAATVPPAILDRARADAVRVAGDPPAPPLPGLTLIVRMA
jgi:uroporphyrin-III C-methyltransferase / precorrin-2 dehydrogenase / sirohydrochlorin ferrochelatase